MSVTLSMVPMFILSSVLLAMARQRECSSPLACLAFAGLFLAFGSIGLSGEFGAARGLAVGATFLLVGLPLASILVSLKPAWFGRSCSSHEGGERQRA